MPLPRPATPRLLSASVAPLVAMLLAGLAGCSSADASPVADPAAGEVDGGASASPGDQADGAASSADAGIDAAPTKRTGTDFRVEYSAKSCDEVCGAWASVRSTCGKACPKDPASVGNASYKGGESTKLATCDDKPAATSPGGASLTSVTCCCETPYIKMKGPSPAVPCKDVCASDGLVCASDAPWNDAGKTARAAGQTTYRSGGGSTTYGLIGCEGVPSATKTVANTKFDFAEYTCGCTDGAL